MERTYTDVGDEELREVKGNKASVVLSEFGTQHIWRGEGFKSVNAKARYPRTHLTKHNPRELH